jgi:hypothetical protein
MIVSLTLILLTLIWVYWTLSILEKTRSGKRLLFAISLILGDLYGDGLPVSSPSRRLQEAASGYVRSLYASSNPFRRKALAAYSLLATLGIVTVTIATFQEHGGMAPSIFSVAMVGLEITFFLAVHFQRHENPRDIPARRAAKLTALCGDPGVRSVFLSQLEHRFPPDFKIAPAYFHPAGKSLPGEIPLLAILTAIVFPAPVLLNQLTSGHWLTAFGMAAIFLELLLFGTLSLRTVALAATPKLSGERPTYPLWILCHDLRELDQTPFSPLESTP